MRPSKITGVVCLLLSLSACGYRAAPLTFQEKQTVSDMTANLKTRCIGRYLIDVPADVFVDEWRTKVQGIVVEAHPMSQEEYVETIAAREKELKARKTQAGWTFLSANGKAWDEGSRYFIRLRDNALTDVRKVIEAYKWHNGYLIKVEAPATDEETSVYVRENPRPKVLRNNVRENTYAVFALLQRIRGRGEDEIPSEPGFCFNGGFVPGKTGDGEEIKRVFRLRKTPDVTIEFRTDTDIADAKSLLQRGGEINAVISQNDDMKTLRKGVVDLPGLKAEEWLLAMPLLPKDIPGHRFMLEANATIGSTKTPAVTLEMENGASSKYTEDKETGVTNVVKASLSVGEAMAFWDVISRTLRPRPNGF
ncbi:T6SS immunity protein Tli4 family protein [Collimonas antrihumi]|uniref:T6SS immunity protein Tli4 family protein n=1 Tax=Collimonas antrihumi TaxID=1940615 RepID=UPI001B8B6110|nr:T6SS immunity protein Tli4 family protein [Collimonas antrihumi]